jgi:hypothetical protein
MLATAPEACLGWPPGWPESPLRLRAARGGLAEIGRNLAKASGSRVWPGFPPGIPAAPVQSTVDDRRSPRKVTLLGCT